MTGSPRKSIQMIDKHKRSYTLSNYPYIIIIPSVDQIVGKQTYIIGKSINW